MPGALPDLPCLCATARRTARTLTQLYDGHLRPSGIEASQFALLSTLREVPGRSQQELARMLAFDKTTLSRNLKVLERNGWIAEASPGIDRRQRAFVVTHAGEKLLKSALPFWRNAQQSLRSRMAPADWDAAWQALARLSEAARGTP